MYMNENENYFNTTQIYVQVQSHLKLQDMIQVHILTHYCANFIIYYNIGLLNLSVYSWS